MFLREIDELDRFFKTIDRLNMLIFNVWHDKTSEAYKNGDMHLLESFYRTYISEMRDLCNEMTTLQQQIEEGQQEIERMAGEIREMKYHPEIEGCYQANVAGLISEFESTVEPIALAPDEVSQMKELAYVRTRRIKEIEDVTLAGPL